MTVNFDHNRDRLTGISEVILAEPKRDRDLVDSIDAALEKRRPVLITRIQTNQIDLIASLVRNQNRQIQWDPYQRTAIIGDINELSSEPVVGVLSGGTSDQPIVEEIVMALKYFRINAVTYSDVGVAGIHRHMKALGELREIPSIECIIVVAGNEGALFSVISAQTSLPVIAVPSSIGYGKGGKGEAALLSALQACSPGVVTVNIDNGFGAATFVKKLHNSKSDG